MSATFAAIKFLLEHLKRHGDNPHSEAAAKHLVAVEREYSEYSRVESRLPKHDDSYSGTSGEAAPAPQIEQASESSPAVEVTKQE